MFYVFAPDRPSALTGFTHQWLDEIDKQIGPITKASEKKPPAPPLSQRDISMKPLTPKP